MERGKAEGGRLKSPLQLPLQLPQLPDVQLPIMPVVGELGLAV